MKITKKVRGEDRAHRTGKLLAAPAAINSWNGGVESHAMRILVIGGTAFIGPHVVTGLHEMGHEITLFHRGLKEAELPPAVQHIHGDRAQLAGFAAEFRRSAPDVVLDMFPFTEQDALALTRTFRGMAPRLVVISSIDVYRAFGRLHGTEPGPPDPMPLTEDSPLREKLSIHGEAYEKRSVERVVMSDPTLPGTILRLPAVYGPGDNQHRLFWHLKRMDDQRPAILMEERSAGWRWSRGYVENVAAAIVRAVTDGRAAGRIYNVAEPEAFPEAEWVRAIGQAAEWKGEVVALPKACIPAHLAWGGNGEQHWVVDTMRIRAELGYHEVVARDEALRRTIEWERAHPPMEIDPKAYDYAAEDAALAAWRQPSSPPAMKSSLRLKLIS